VIDSPKKEAMMLLAGLVLPLNLRNEGLGVGLASVRRIIYRREGSFMARSSGGDILFFRFPKIL
jgi:hypothetical protein